jgi:hypothetical protein
VIADVEPIAVERGRKVVECPPRGRVDDDVNALCRARLSVIRAGERAREHVWDPSILEGFDNDPQRVREAHRDDAATRSCP